MPQQRSKKNMDSGKIKFAEYLFINDNKDEK